ncbi:unnamed protein product [Sympodiomycopsis kandeliae]
MALKKSNASDLPAKPEIYSHVTQAGPYIYVSGQLPVNTTGQLISGNVQDHTKQCILNIEKALKSIGADLNDLVKCNIFLKDMGDFNAINEVYSKMLPSPKPSRTCVQAGKLPMDTDIEIEAIAYKAQSKL